MKTKILIVDEDPSSSEDSLRYLRQEYLVEIASNCEIAINSILESEDSYAVVVSELFFENKLRIDFFRKIIELSPTTVRIAFSKKLDPSTILSVINDAKVSKYLCKPCEPIEFQKNIHDAVSDHKAEIAKLEILTKTLTGSVHVLMEILSIVNPSGFGMAEVIRNTTKKIAKKMRLQNVWECEVAAMLCLIGTVSIPVYILEKIQKLQALSPKEERVYQQHPEFGASLVRSIPRLQVVSDYIRYHHKSYNGSGYPKDDRKGEDIPIGARILRVAADFEKLRERGLTSFDSFVIIQDNETDYDLQVVAALEEVIEIPRGYINMAVDAVDLPVNCILSEDVVTEEGRLLIVTGQIVDETTKTKIIHHSNTVGVKQPIHVRYRRVGTAVENAKL